MEKWLESARAALRAYGAVPTDMEQLEDAIQVRTGKTFVWKPPFLTLFSKINRSPKIDSAIIKATNIVNHFISLPFLPGPPRVPDGA